MAKDQTTRLVTVAWFSDEQERQVQLLREACRHAEPLELPLDLTRDSTAVQEVTGFLCYQSGQLAGFANLPVGPSAELVGAVHPDFRRLGIGRKLVAAALRETARRNADPLILVCETAAGTGIQFARALGARPDSSEFQLELRAEDWPGHQAEATAVSLRDARDCDASLLTQIGEEVFGIGNAPDQLQIGRWLKDTKQRFVIGSVAGLPVGALRITRSPGDRTASIYTFGIRPASRRRGYGRQLLEQVVASLFQDGSTSVRLEVDSSNLPALDLYRSCGFKTITEYQYFRVPVEPDPREAAKAAGTRTEPCGDTHSIPGDRGVRRLVD